MITKTTWLTLLLFICCTIVFINGAYAQNTPTSTTKTDTTTNCGCAQIQLHSRGFRYYNSLSDYIKESSIVDVTGWTLAGTPFKYLFVGESQSSFSTDGSSRWNNFTVIANRAPIQLFHPNKSFTITLSPCTDGVGDFRVPVNVIFNQPILGTLRDFDYTKFDHTTQAYVHLLLQLSGKRPDEVIRNELREQARRGDGLLEMNRTISAINSEFQTGIPLVTEKNYRDSAVIQAVLDSLVSKKLRQEKVIATGFILSEPGIHHPTPVEDQRLYGVFSPYYYYFNSVNQFDRDKLRPNIRLDMDIKRANIEISPAIIQQAHNNKEVNAALWGDVKSAAYTTEDGLTMFFNSVCLPATTITGTAVGIDFTNADLLADPAQSIRQLNYGWYPQFAITKNAAKQPAIQYDSLLTAFTGLFVKEARLKVPFGKDTLRFTGSNLIINNFLIAGYMALPLAPIKANAVLVTGKNGKQQGITVNRLLAVLKGSGLTDLLTKVIDGQVFVYFRKLM